jgi:hypothetical protein
MATRFRLNFEQIFGTSAQVLAGGSLTFCISGGSPSQLRTIWQDAALSVTKLNPVVIDSAGKHGDIWLDDPSLYRVLLKDAAGIAISGGDIDPLNGGLGSSFVTADGAPNSQTVADRWRRMGYNLADFLTPAEQDQVDAGGMTIDLAPKFILAMQTIYNAGGGTLWLPPGAIALSTVPFTWGAARSINIIGAGGAATYLRKFGNSASAVLDFNATNVMPMFSEFRDFAIAGDAGLLCDGLKLTNLANCSTRNLYISGCNVGIRALGYLVSSHDNLRLINNNIGYLARKSSANVRNNRVEFFGGQIVGNYQFGVDWGDGTGVLFLGTDFESNGTAGNLTTGALQVRSTVDDETGLAQFTLDACHFESNLGGYSVNVESATALQMTIANSFFITPEGGRAIYINLINRIALSEIQAPGYTVWIGADTSVLRGVYLGGGTLTDNSTHRNYIAVSANNILYPVVVPTIYSYRGNTGSIASGAASTIAAASAGETQVIAWVAGQAAAGYTARAAVLVAGPDARIITSNGTFLTLSVSGLNVQVTQTSGAAQTVEFTFLRIGDQP